MEVRAEMVSSLESEALSSVLTSHGVEFAESFKCKRLECSLMDDDLIVYTRRKKSRFSCFVDGFSEKIVRNESVCDFIEQNCNVVGFGEKGKDSLDEPVVGEGDAQWAQVAIGEEIDDLDMSVGYEVEVEGMKKVLSVNEVMMKSEVGLGSELTATNKNLEMKMLKKVLLNQRPSTVRELFETGLFEGVTVVYMGGRKENALRGTIKDVGILCSCSLCMGRRVIVPSQFEIHACKAYKRASQYICFENGMSLLEVLKICKGTPLHMLETAIQKVLSSLPTGKTFTCRRCKGSSPAKCLGKAGPLCHLCVANESQCFPPHARVETARPAESVLIPKSRKTASVRITLDKPPCRSTTRSSTLSQVSKSLGSASLSVSSDNKNRSVNSLVKSKISEKASEKNEGKISKRYQSLHKLVFEKGGLPDGSEVAYFCHGQKLLDGYKTASGIFCCCCNSEVSPSQFEAHAGWGPRRKPYYSIYTSNGVSLHELALSLSRGRKYSANDNDTLCTICLDGGNLLLCDGCPRAYHIECASLSSTPRGDWYCIYCESMFQSQEFVEHNANAVAASRMSGVDSIEQITRRCIGIVGDIAAADHYGCTLCKAHDFCKTGFGPRTIILCDQCEKEYHVGCLRSKKMADLKEIPKGDWFCCMDCTRINSTLQELVSRGGERPPGFILGIMRNKFAEKGLDTSDDLNVSWRVLCGKVTSPETRLLLSEAVSIFHESFDPINDLITGKDLIPSMVYGRNTKGHELTGMYCAVLTVNSSVESAAVFRIFGQEVAELPLVATRKGNHGKGYFQILYSAIENLLAFLKVGNIVLPAADEVESIWTDKFGFKKVKPDQLCNYRNRWRQMMTFQGTTMLEKIVPEDQIDQKITESMVLED